MRKTLLLLLSSLVIFSCGEKLPSGDGNKPGSGTTETPGDRPDEPQNPDNPSDPGNTPSEGALAGDGSESNPYVITKVEHIAQVQLLLHSYWIRPWDNDIHPNEFGAKAFATAIYRKVVELGYVD